MQRLIICRAGRLIECVVVFKILTEILVASFHHRYHCHCPGQLPARCRCQPLWRLHCIFQSIYMVMEVVIRTLLALQYFQLHLFQCRHCETVKTRKKKLYYWIGFILFDFKFDKKNFIDSHGQPTTHYTRTTPSTEWKKKSKRKPNTHFNNKECSFCGYVCVGSVYLHCSMEIVWQFSVVDETVQWKIRAHCSFAVSLILTF